MVVDLEDIQNLINSLENIVKKNSGQTCYECNVPINLAHLHNGKLYCKCHYDLELLKERVVKLEKQLKEEKLRRKAEKKRRRKEGA